jgi:hypothetical protein
LRDGVVGVEKNTGRKRESRGEDGRSARQHEQGLIMKCILMEGCTFLITKAAQPRIEIQIGQWERVYF